MPNTPKLFIVEYSMIQNATNIGTLDVVMENNRENLMKGNVSDYVPIGLFNSRAEADQFKIAFQPTLDEQAQFEFKNRKWRHISEVLSKLLSIDHNSQDSDD
jgi:hypothetical protein